MRSATRLLVVTLTGFIVALLPVHAFADPHPSDREYGLVANQPAPPTTEPAPPTTTGAGTVSVTRDKTEAEVAEEKAEQRRKLVMGIASAVLLGAVIWGRSVRRKKAKAG